MLSTPPNSKLNKILVVDSDPEITRQLSSYLRTSGYHVLTADSGEKAESIVEQEQPSFVITDWELPGLSGLELCRRIRGMGLSNYVYVVFLTKRDTEADLAEAMYAGADDFLTKPLRKQELLARLNAGTRVVRLQSQLSIQATQDELTGLYVRRFFKDLLEKNWTLAQQVKRPLSVAILDIDHFKRINDEHGHHVGDEVIKTVARTIQDSTRASDIVCRYGGEEYCVLLPDLDEPSAVRWAERLRKAVEEMTISHDDTTVTVTISIGVAEMMAGMEDSDELVGLADHSLLLAKQLGRNCTRSSTDLVEFDSANPLKNSSPFAQAGAQDAMIPLFHRLSLDWHTSQAAEYLLQCRVSSAPVTDRAGGLLGVISDKDILAVAESQNPSKHVVENIMKTNVVTFDVQTSLAHILKFMVRSSSRSVVITRDDKPCGLVTRATILRWMMCHVWGGNTDGDGDADCSVTNEVEQNSPLRGLADELVSRADNLRKHLLEDTASGDLGPLIGGVSNIQQLIEEILACSAIKSGGDRGIPC